MPTTSLGAIGGSLFTPIINYPEVAILGVGKSKNKIGYKTFYIENNLSMISININVTKA